MMRCWYPTTWSSESAVWWRGVQRGGRAQQHHVPAHGSTTAAPVVSKSATFRVTTVIRARWRWPRSARAVQPVGPAPAAARTSGPREVDRQRALRELGQHVAFDPGPQPLPLPGVATFDAQDAYLQLHQGQRGDEEARSVPAQPMRRHERPPCRRQACATRQPRSYRAGTSGKIGRRDFYAGARRIEVDIGQPRQGQCLTVRKNRRLARCSAVPMRYCGRGLKGERF